MRRTIEASLARVLGVYALGVLGGVQVALYLFDRFDDGVADALSGVIGAGIVAVGLVVALWPFVRRGSGG